MVQFQISTFKEMEMAGSLLFIACVCVCACLILLSHGGLFVTPWTLAHQVLCPWDSPGKNTGVGCHSPLQGIFPTQGSNLGLLHCRWVLYCLSHQGMHELLLLMWCDALSTDKSHEKRSTEIL